MSDALNVSVKGKRKILPAIKLCGVSVLLKGRLIKTGAIFDEYWLNRDELPNPEIVIAELKEKKEKPDFFTFVQRVPETEPMYDYYCEMENYAVLPLSAYEEWFQKQIPSGSRQNIRASEKRGIIIKVSEYDDDYVKGIMSIFNETPIRAGRKYWHYGKDFETVKNENGTYQARSIYLAAYCQDEMVGYLKIVYDKHTAAIMQILSKTAFRSYRPNNALMAEAVKQCCLRHIKFLLYEKFDYGKKTGDSLTKFKQNNGFIRMDLPRYYIPLTIKGFLALKFGLHKNPVERIPEWIASPLRNLRTKSYETMTKE
jgi:hypothetical protein